ncbi:hypothetical protein Efla_002437 [Eimeria flavescens]
MEEAGWLSHHNALSVSEFTEPPVQKGELDIPEITEEVGGVEDVAEPSGFKESAGTSAQAPNLLVHTGNALSEKEAAAGIPSDRFLMTASEHMEAIARLSKNGGRLLAFTDKTEPPGDAIASSALD